MATKRLPLNRVVQGDCLQVMERMPEGSIDLIFADPPYNLQLSQELWRPNLTRVNGVADAWDRFESFQHYDEFTRAWLGACRRVLKPDGCLWVIGTYHNIYRVGAILQDLGFWILNDVLWIKTNPMPNFRGVRFTNAHETLIWAATSNSSRYTFNYHAMKQFNDGKQMRSDWVLPLCTGKERIKLNGKKAHATQKPEALLTRVLLASTDPGDIVLDPFFGTGTTGAVAKYLGRQWIGIEKEPRYIEIARRRIEAVEAAPAEARALEVRPAPAPRVPFASLLEAALIRPGQKLYFKKDRGRSAWVKPDGQLRLNGIEGSIHQLGRHLAGGGPCNGWEHWFYESQSGALEPIDRLRERLRAKQPH
ncbi:MAG: site-specific DNA-methyltransferase [Anaerolineales bacterium]